VLEICDSHLGDARLIHAQSIIATLAVQVGFSGYPSLVDFVMMCLVA
jgi:hypothetical protein